MSTPTNKPAYVTLHRLGDLSGKARNTLLLKMRDGELLAAATLDVGGTPHPPQDPVNALLTQGMWWWKTAVA